MTEKIPVFDSWGKKVGDFIPAGSGEGCGMAFAAMFFALLYCTPILNLIGPPIVFLWARSRPENYPLRKFWVVVSKILLALWAIGMVFLVAYVISEA